MSASEEINPAYNGVPPIKKLGVIAGGGEVPYMLLDACDQQGIEVFIIGFEDQTDPALVQGRKHLWTRLGAAGKAFEALKKHGVRHVTLIGSIRRPTLKELKPDLRTTAFFARIAFKALGDNDLLGCLREELESEGISIHGVHKFAHDLLMPLGTLGKYKPKKQDQINIGHGLKISQELGRLDVGQSVIVQEGIVLGVEAVEGTDQLIARCTHLARKGRGGTLVKTCKPQQDKDFDLPTIGPDTIRNAHNAGLVGLVVHAHNALLIHRDEVVRLADEYKMFIIGVEINGDDHNNESEV